MLFSSLVLVPILSTVEHATERFLSLFFFFCLDKRNLHVELIVLTWKQDKMEDLKKKNKKKTCHHYLLKRLAPVCLYSEDNTTTGIAVKDPGRSIPVCFILKQTGECLQSDQRSFPFKSQYSLALTSVEEAIVLRVRAP